MTGDSQTRAPLRWASALNLTMHSALLVMAPVLVSSQASRRHSVTQITFAIAAAVVLASVHLRHVRAAANGESPAAWPLTLAVQVLLVYAPVFWLGPDWTSAQLPLAASMMLLLPRSWGPAVGFTGQFLASEIVYFLLYSKTLSLRDTLLESVYYAISFAVFAPMLYGTVRLVRLVTELYRSREELAASAVDTERVRVFRDLHDLLGQSLSAISLKGDLATRLLSVDPARARHEITSLAELARSTLRDVRAVTRDEHQVTLREELAAAQGLLAAAGVDARIDAEVDGTGLVLSDAAQQVLAWAVREGTTNLLRHSDATACTITLTQATGTTSLTIRNDGVRQPRIGDGSGLAGVEARAAAIGGWADGQLSGNDEFQLSVTLPSRTPRQSGRARSKQRTG